ncbi:hypothetical protein RV10_GL003163 [Enterococcus pallens]|nr:hypothetical protein RV10_GL003163 [Enterococcus pallens]
MELAKFLTPELKDIDAVGLGGYYYKEGVLILNPTATRT